MFKTIGKILWRARYWLPGVASVLIGAGLSVVIGAPTAMFCIGLGLGLLVGAYLPRPTINITQAQNASPAMHQEQAASLQTAREPQPIINCLGVRTPQLRLSAFEGWVFYEANEGTFSGAVVCFRNRIGASQKEGKSAFGVTAHIILRDSKGQEIGPGVSRLCWVGRTGYKVDLKAGESEARCALVLCHDQLNKEKSITVPFKKPIKTRWGDRFLDQLYIPSEEPRTIELTLLDGDNERLLPPIIIRTGLVDGKLHAEKL